MRVSFHVSSLFPSACSSSASHEEKRYFDRARRDDRRKERSRGKKREEKKVALLPAVARLALRNAYRDTWLRQCYFASGKLGRCNESYETWYVFIGGVLISQLVWYWGACFILYWLESKNLPYWRLLLLWNECWIIVYIKSSKPGINTIVDFSIN